MGLIKYSVVDSVATIVGSDGVEPKEVIQKTIPEAFLPLPTLRVTQSCGNDLFCSLGSTND